MDVIESHPGNYVYDVMPGVYQICFWALAGLGGSKAT